MKALQRSSGTPDTAAAVSPAPPRRPSTFFLTALGLIALLALALRVHHLDDIPNGFHVDEASIGFNARCVLETGSDEHGERFPLYFKAFGEYKNPLFVYACVPLTALFGSSVFSVRLTAALLGAITVFATGLLGSALVGRLGGLTAAALLAFSPWHFQFSRIAFEAISLPLFVTLAVWLLILADRRPHLLVAAAVPLAAATYCYGVAKLFVPLLLAGFVVLRARWLWRHRRSGLGMLALLALLVLPNLHATVTGEVQSRFKRLSIATHPAGMDLGRALWHDAPLVRSGPKWLRESTTGAKAAVFVHNYRLHLSPGFLGSRGDANPRHNPGGGMLSRTELVATACGVLALIVGIRRWTSAFLLWWLVIAPVPASLTAVGIPHAVRTIVLLPLPQVLAAIGICAAVAVERSCWTRVERWLQATKLASRAIRSRLVRLPVVTASVIACLWPVDVGGHLSWYFTVFPREVWRPFFWEENAIAGVMRDRIEIERFFIGGESRRVYDVTLLFVMQVSPEVWQRERRVPRVERRYPAPELLQPREAVICLPGEPRFQELRLMTRIVDPLGRPSADVRTASDPATDPEQDDNQQ